MAAKKKTVAQLSREIAKLRKELPKHEASDKRIHTRQRVSPQSLSSLSDINANGLSFFEWLRAAGVVQAREHHRAAWASGEDPSDWRAQVGPKAMRGPKVRVVKEPRFIHPCCGAGGSSPRSTPHKANCQQIVRELYDALVAPTGIYQDGKARYEALRNYLISEHGYNKFRDLQSEAMKRITKKGNQW